MITGLFIFLQAEVGFHLLLFTGISSRHILSYNLRLFYTLALLPLRCSASLSYQFPCMPAAFAQRTACAEGKTSLYRPAAPPVFVQPPFEWKNMVILTQERQVMQKENRKTKDIVKSLLSLFNLSPNSQQHANAKELALDGFFCYDG